MNERIKELAEQAKLAHVNLVWLANNSDLERFAELIRQDEREACAKLCDEFIGDLPWSGAAKYFQKAIRARGNYEQD
jgi:hypothetical protein